MCSENELIDVRGHWPLVFLLSSWLFYYKCMSTGVYSSYSTLNEFINLWLFYKLKEDMHMEHSRNMRVPVITYTEEVRMSYITNNSLFFPSRSEYDRENPACHCKVQSSLS